MKIIHGWFDYHLLYDWAVSEAPQKANFVEIGCWLGKSIVYLAEKVKKSGKDITIYAVDHWKGSNEPFHQDYISGIGGPDALYKQFLDNTFEYRDIIRIIRQEANEAASNFPDESLDFVFLDASHDYINVKSNLISWKPKIKQGSIFAGHDYIKWISVAKAVDEFFGGSIMIRSDTPDCWIWRNQ